VNNTLKARIVLVTQQSQEISQLVKSLVNNPTDNPDSSETHQHLDYITSVIREGFTGNIMSSFNVPLKDLLVKPLEQGSVQRLSCCALDHGEA
jgi:pyruvate carboxylase